MNLGAHMSIAGGVQNALKLGNKAECGAVQLFTKNNNQWAGKVISREDADEFRELARGYRPENLISHTSYLINLGSPGGDVLEKSIPGMVDELERFFQGHETFFDLTPRSLANRQGDAPP